MSDSLHPMDRSACLARLEREEFDVLVVGGGITGAGVAWEAALRGRKVALVEMGDFAWGTSSRSSKLIHGGIRYLEQGDVHLVFEATNERARLMRHAPHLVRPLPFVLPVYREHHYPPWIVGLGLWIYDALALFRNYRKHRRLSIDEVAALEPGLRTEGLRGAMLYYDAITDDARLTLAAVRAAAQAGAVVANYVRYEEPVLSPGSQLEGAVVRDMETGRTWQVSARVVALAAGPWTNAALERGGNRILPMVRPTKGVHVVVPGTRLGVRHAVVMQARRDRRVTFVIPWDDSTVIGTTDTDYEGRPEEVRASRDDVDYLIETANWHFPRAALSADDVVSTWAGLRPLVRDESPSPYQATREHRVERDPRGFVAIAGGKLTTFRVMAADCVDAIEEFLPGGRSARHALSARHCLPGAQALDVAAELDRAVSTLGAAPIGLPEAAARRIFYAHGTAWRAIAERAQRDPEARRWLHPDFPVLAAELTHAIDEEMARTPGDFLIRRTPAFYHLGEAVLEALPAVLAALRERLGLDAAAMARHEAALRDTVERAMRWRHEATAQAAPGHARA